MTVIVKDGMVQVWMLEGGLRSMNKVMEVDLGSEEVLRGTIAFATQGNSGPYLQGFWELYYKIVWDWILTEILNLRNTKHVLSRKMPHYPKDIEYSDKYKDDTFEYRHVILPKTVFKKMDKKRLLSEMEWRAIGVQQSRGWAHYEIHTPEPFILLFRRPLGTDPRTGRPPAGFNMELLKA